MRRSALIALVPCLAATLGAGSGAGGGDKEDTEFLTKPGKYELYEGKLIVEVREDDGVLRFDINFVRPGSTAGVAAKSSAVRAKGWFVHPVSPSQAWFYQGSEVLYLLERKTGQDRVTITTVRPGTKDGAAVLRKAPNSVMDRLPESFKSEPKKE